MSWLETLDRKPAATHRKSPFVPEQARACEGWGVLAASYQKKMYVSPEMIAPAASMQSKKVNNISDSPWRRAVARRKRTPCTTDQHLWQYEVNCYK
ncbi:MAG: hypothetical protein ACLGSA_06685 [Acidobacteriota bacterium]